MGIWSSGMILLSGGRGPEFNSRNAPPFLLLFPHPDSSHRPFVATFPLLLIASNEKEVKTKIFNIYFTIYNITGSSSI